MTKIQNMEKLEKNYKKNLLVQKCVHFCQDACKRMVNCENGKEELI
jgi:hypothetical protein